MKRTALATLAFICLTAFTQAQHFSAEDLARRAIERRAVEAVIWGMPAVNLGIFAYPPEKVYSSSDSQG